MSIKFKTLFLSFVFYASCGQDISEEEVNNVVVSCENQTLEQIAQQNSVSDECREAVIALLPEELDELSGKLHVLDHQKKGSDAVVYLSSVSSVRTVEVTDSQGRVLNADEFSIIDYKSWDSVPFGLTFVSDYSASMREKDIEIASELFIDIATNMKGFSEVSSVIFSDKVATKLTGSNDLASITKSFALDKNFERHSTALYDGAVAGLKLSKSKNTELKVLIVSTDGMENASSTKKEELTTFLNDNKSTFVIALGSLFADFNQMKVLTAVNGLMLYAPQLQVLKARALQIKTLLQNTKKIVIPNSTSNGYTVKVGSQTVKVPMELLK